MSLQAFPYHWHHYEEYGATKLRIFCLSGKNESIYIEIDDFLPYIYIELPTDKTWSPASLSVVQTKLKEMSFNSIVKMEFVSKKKLYFAKKDKTEAGEYVDKTYPFLKCFFKTTTNIRTFSYKLRQPIFFSGSKITLKVHESDANPVLQFMCMMDIKPASWFAFKGKKRESEDERESLCHHEFLCSYRHFAPIDNKGKVPARPYILSFDIEVNSNNPNVFPQSSQPEDKVFQISCVFARNGDPEEKFEKYILTLCKNKKGEIVDLNMDKLGEGIEVLGYETEGQLLEGFKDLVLEKNPQIICGYNIFSFDILYLYERSKVCNIERQFTQFSCMRGVPCKMKEISWSSSAFKNQEFKYLDAHGRLWIDLLPIIQRDYKLENYKLKTVSDQFLAASKDPLTPKGIFKCYRMFTPDSLALVGKYCVQDSNLVLKLFEKLQIWIGLCEMSNTCNTPMFTLFTQGQQIKIFSQVYKKCMADNIVIDKDSFVTNESDRFTGAYVFPPVPGLYEMVVSFDFSSLYPSTIISNNIDYSTLVLDPSIPDEKCHVIEWEEHINCTCPGAEIKTTKKEVVCDKQRHRFMKEPMGVLPTLLKNLLDARKRTNAEMKQMTIELEEMKDKGSVEYDDKKRMITVLDKRQLSYKISANSMYGGMGTRKGYLPFLYGATCTTAKGRQSIEKASKFLVENYRAKLIYGDTDSCYINFSEYADKTKAKDLDSFCRQVESEISSLFPKPMKFAYEEQIYWRYLILTKKRYMALKCDLDGNVDNKIAKRGVLLSRRDNSKYIRDTYANTILKSFYREDLDVVLWKLFEDVKKLCVNALPIKDLVVTKGIGAIADYKIRPLHIDDKKCKKRLQELGLYHEEASMDVLRNIITAFGRKEDIEDESYLHNLEYLIFKEYVKLSLPAQIQLAERMRARGSHVSAGERLGYVITQNGDKLGEKMEDTDYFKEHAESLKIDYLYYMKLMINPFDEVLETVYGEKDLFKKFYKTREQFKKVIDQLQKLFMPRLRFVE
jgi:DNA polymerase elongation subunit (family B)